MDPEPSSFSRRLPAALLALAGFAIAAYLGGYQVGWWPSVWDPIFGAASARVLHSSLSRAFPVPDAWIGAGAYLVELVLELAGSARRWREQPWLTAANMGLVGLMAVGGVGLVAGQAVVIRAWCSLCLLSAACSFAVAGLSWVEMRAVAGVVARQRV